MTLTVSDQLQIQQTLAAYCHIADYGEPDAMAALFTDDMVFTASASQTFHGMAQFLDMLRARLPTRDRVRHLIANIVIEDDAGVVRSRCYLQLVKIEEGVPQLLKLVRYVDEWACCAGVWRIRHRRIEN